MTRYRFFRSCSLLPFVLLTLTATAGDIQLGLEEPANGSIYSGVSNLRGWAVSSVGINRVELFLDGALLTQIPSGSLSLRTDVGNIYPTYPNSSQSGFSWTQNYSSLTAGPHTLSVNVFDNQGSQRSAVASFNVARFNNSYISNPAAVSLNAATIADDNDKAILINNLIVEGQSYNVRLEWRAQIQGFALTSINTAGQTPPPVNEIARWSAYNNACCTNSAGAPFPLTYEVTVDGVTKRSVSNSCTTDSTFEGFASTTPGIKNVATRALSSACGNFSGSATATMAVNACYRFQLNIENGSPVTRLGTVTCPSSPNANVLQEDIEATPMAIFPMSASTPEGAEAPTATYQAIRRQP